MWAFGRWGGALAPPVAFFVIYHFGWRWGFVALAFLGVAWVAFFLPVVFVVGKPLVIGEFGFRTDVRRRWLGARRDAWFRHLVRLGVTHPVRLRINDYELTGTAPGGSLNQLRGASRKAQARLEKALTARDE